MTEEPRSGRAAPLVSGADIRTFLFADMRGWTRYTQEQGDDAAAAAAGRFANLVRVAAPEFEGELLELRGDEALCVFRSARQALRASVEIQRRLRTETDDEPAFPIGVGMGLDAGEAVPTHGGYRGASLNQAARLCASAKPGEILATETVTALASRIEGIRFIEGRSATLKGIQRPMRYAAVEPETPLPPLPRLDDPSRHARKRRWYLAAAAALTLLLVAVIAEVRSSSSNQATASGDIPKSGVVRIAEVSDKTAVSPIRPTPQGLGDLGFGFGRLWVTTAQGLSRVNPKTGRVDASVGLTGCSRCPGAPFAIGLGRVFVTGGGDGSNNVQVIDPGEPTTVQKVIPTQPFKPDHSQGAFFIATRFRSIWVWPSGEADCCDGRMFWRINPASGRRLASWPAPNRLGFDHSKVEHVVAVGAGGVWFIRDDQLWRITPSTNTATGGFTTDASMVTVADGAVWTITDGITEDDVITEINPALFPQRRAVIWQHRLPGHVDDIVASGSLLWMFDDFAHRLTIVNATSRRISQLPLPPTSPGQLAAGQGVVWLGYPSILR